MRITSKAQIKQRKTSILDVQAKLAQNQALNPVIRSTYINRLNTLKFMSYCINKQHQDKPMTFDKHSLTLFVGQHEFLTLSCQAIIDARYVFLFIRLLRELNALSSQQSAFHVFYIDIDKRTGIPTPSIDVLGI